MKNQTLSIEQMKHLRELGVDTSKASMVLLFNTEDGTWVGWEVTDNGKNEKLYQYYNADSEVWESTHMEFLDAETGNYDHSYRKECGVFTLQDLYDILRDQNPTSQKQMLIRNHNGYILKITANILSDKREFGYYKNPIECMYEYICVLAKLKRLKSQ